MTLDEQLEQLSHLQCPRQVDVTDRVMERLAQPAPRVVPLWRRLGPAAAAAVALFAVVGLSLPYLRSYDEEGMAGTMAQLNDYSSWNPVEDLATDPYDYFYNDEP